MNRFFDEMKSAFEKADTYWPGNTMLPHYNGVLFTDKNLYELQQLADMAIDWSTVAVEAQPEATE